MRLFRHPLIAILAALFVWTPVAAQSTGSRVLSASPNGEINDVAEANEIRIQFSEPMIALGRSIEGRPSWLTVTPAIDATYRWFGSSMLVVTPNPNKPLPLSTTYTLAVAKTAINASGQPLASAFQFTFTTPTAKLLSVQSERQGGRFDAPVLLFLRFNQPVRAADVAAHVTVRHEAFQFAAPTLTADARTRLTATDPNGLAAFTAKVAAARAAAASTDPTPVRVSTTWDKKRRPEAPTLVVLETITAPPAGVHLRVTLDARLPSPAGPAIPGRAQSSTTELTPVFFARRMSCASDCGPSDFRGVEFSTDVIGDAFAKAVTVADVTTPGRDTPVTPKGKISTAGDNAALEIVSLETAGYSRQPGMTKWMLHLDPSLTAADGQTLGYPWIGFVQTSRDFAFTSFGDGHGVWEKSSGATLPFYARNYRDIAQWVTPIAPGDLMTRLRELTVARFAVTPPGAGTRRSLTVAPDVIQSHGFDLTPTLKNGTGLVWAAVGPGAVVPGAKERRNETPDSTVVQVTNIGLTVKDSQASTLIFATRLDNGQPEPDVNVSLVDLQNTTLWKGKTNADGVAMAPSLQLRKTPKGLEDELRWSDFRFIAIGEKNGDVAYVGSDWSEGITPWEFGMSYSNRPVTDPILGSVFTDRGVYRPGEAIHFKTILRKNTNGVEMFAAGSKAYVSVTDNRGRSIDTREIILSKWSSADWSWTVPAGASIGYYNVLVSLDPPKAPKTPDVSPSDDEGDEGSSRGVATSWLVAAYRRPDFRVDTTLVAASPIAGDSLKATVSGKYLFGNAMAKRPVRWTLERSPAYGAPSEITGADLWKDFSFGYTPSGPNRDERTAGETAPLGADGTLTLTLPTTKNVDVAYSYSFSGEVEDVSRQRIAGQSNVTIYPAPFLIGLKLPDYFASTTTGATVQVGAADLDGRARAGVRVNLKLIRVQWNSVHSAEGGGFYEWESTREEIPAGEWTVETGSSPVTQIIPVPEGGYYELRATATDATGHSTRTDTSFYGIGNGYTAWKRFDNSRIELKPEHDKLKPGDTAKIMIMSPWEQATGLLTIEREGVRSYKKFALTSTQQTIDVPVGENDIPNVYVSVLLVRGRTSSTFGEDGSDPGKPQFRLGYTELHIEDSSKRLTVTVKADREEYRPTTTAKVAITAMDKAGKGAASEVTLWAVDYGVLSLTGYVPPDIRQQIYMDRELRVTTTDNRQRLVQRRVMTPKGDGEGGGGGEDAGAGALRKDFRPLAFWLGSVETNSSGKATAEVKLPDSLTTYHIMAVAGDAASRFGTTTSEIRVSKPLTLLPSLPRFLVVGDKASIGGTVSNTLATGGKATVTIKSLDPSILAVSGSTDISLGAKASEAVRFSAEARATGVARIQLSAKLGGNSDALETTIPINVVSATETVATAGQVTDRASIPLAIPVGVAPNIGGLRIDLSSSALAGLGEGARYVNEYPYFCAEQKATRALVLALAADLGKAFSMSNIEAKDYKFQASSVLRSLENYQCPSGSFALWPGQCGNDNAYLTAYVLDVMHIAASVGIPSDPQIVAEASRYLETALHDEAPRQVQFLPVWQTSHAYAVKVLAEGGHDQSANITRLYTNIAQTPVLAMSYLADAMAAEKDRGARYQDVIRRITNAVRVENDQAHAESVSPDVMSWIWDSSVTTTAVALDGFARRGDNPALAAPMVRWLLLARHNGRWDNTHENGRALAALVRYYRAFEAAEPNFSATATLGTRTLGSATFKGRTTDVQTITTAMKDALAASATGDQLAFNMNGTGTLFYNTRLQFSPTMPPPAASNGFTLERKFETFVESGDGVPGTTYAAGDLVRVTLVLSVPNERHYVAVTDSLPAGFEAVDGFFRTTAADLAREASSTGPEPTTNAGWLAWWIKGGFDRVEKFDNRVELFATRLGTGRHEFSYLVRATTSGTFSAAGAHVEEMYTPAVNARSAAATIIVK